jgi:hypothetical protein
VDVAAGSESEHLVSFSAGETKIVTAVLNPSDTSIDVGLDARNHIVPGGSNETGYTITITRAWLYRSDLGGMVDNPDRGDSYVPTTSSALYLPRIGHHVYNGSAWVNEGYLHESEARTNEITYSEDFTDVSWLKANTGTLAIDATGPDGETSAVTLVDNGAGGTGLTYVDETVSVSVSTAYTFSTFAKADQLSWLHIALVNFSSPGNGGAYFDLSNGTIGATITTTLTPLIEDFGNGWYRCSVTFTTDAVDTSGNLRLYVADGDNDPVIDRDGTSSILIYGAQLEAGSFPTSYIPTSGSTATRSADVASIPVADFGYNQTNVVGTFYVEFSAPFAAISGVAGRGLSVTSTLGTGNRAFDCAAQNGVAVDVYSNHTAGALYNLTPYVSDGFNKVAATMKENDSAACSNGGTVVTDTTTTVPIDAVYFNIGKYSTSYTNGHIKSIKYYPRRLTNAQLVELTS